MDTSAVVHGRGRSWLKHWPEDAVEAARLPRPAGLAGEGAVWAGTGLKAGPVATGEQCFYVFQPIVSCV